MASFSAFDFSSFGVVSYKSGLELVRSYSMQDCSPN